jgi:hypothetical protein
MHVDGGATVEVFFYGSILDIESGYKTLGIEDKPEVRLFIIRNAIIQPEYQAVKPRISSVAAWRAWLSSTRRTWCRLSG